MFSVGVALLCCLFRTGQAPKTPLKSPGKEEKLGMKKIGILMITLLSIFISASIWAAEDDYPNKPIQLICPYGAGGVTDVTARLIGDKMAEHLGRPILVVNKPGGGTALGTGFVAASKADGYTLLINMTGGFIVTPLITPNLPYKMSDLSPVGKVVTAGYLILVNKDLPVKTLNEFIAYVKKNPGTLSYGSPGVGTVDHLAMELLRMQTQLDLQHIPYASQLPVITALMGNHVQAAPGTSSISLSYIKSGQIRALAALSEQRDPLLPDVPTTGEQGFPGLTASVYNILYVPSKTPASIVKKLEGTLEKTLQDKGIREKFKDLNLKIDFLSSRETQAFLDDEVKKWSEVVKKANVAIK